jgi:purine nucleosidase
MLAGRNRHHQGGIMARCSLLFDVDTGVDDALALLLALRHPEAEVVGIGTVAGNVDVDKCTENSLQVLRLVDRLDVPVARGCPRPLVQPYASAAEVHGNSGLGGTNLPPSGLTPTGEHAVDQLIRLAEARPGELTLVAVGPLTNVAVALMRQPALPTLLKDVVIMGGAFAHPGNSTALSEFNIWVDPEAARMVFEAPFRMTIVPLDATMQVLLEDDHLASLGDGALPDFVRGVTGDYIAMYARRRGRRAAAMHDPLAAAIAIDPTLMVDAPTLPVTVETEGRWARGQTVADRRPGQRADSPPGRATVCLRPDVSRFFDLFLPALRGA